MEGVTIWGSHGVGLAVSDYLLDVYWRRKCIDGQPGGVHDTDTVLRDEPQLPIGGSDGGRSEVPRVNVGSDAVSMIEDRGADALRRGAVCFALPGGTAPRVYLVAGDTYEAACHAEPQR